MQTSVAGAAAQQTVAEAENREIARHSANALRCDSFDADSVPKSSWEEWGIALLVSLLSFAYLCLFRHFNAIEPDEGIVLQGAQRILTGQVLYRDFFSFYTPGSFYWLALFFRIFGSSILVSRMLLAAYGGACSALTYLVARRVCSRWSALCAAGAVTVICFPYRFLVLHNWDSTFWAYLALYCAVRWLEACSPVKSIYHGDRREHGEHREVAQSFPLLEILRFFREFPRTSRRPRKARGLRYPAWKWAFATGSLITITALFEQSKGAGLALGLTAGFLVIAFACRGTVRLSRVHLIAAVLGFTWPFVLTFACFGAAHSLPQLMAGWLWPLKHYSAANSVPYGYQDWSNRTRAMLFSGSWSSEIAYFLVESPSFLFPLLLILAPAILAYWSIEGWRKKLPPETSAYYALVSGAVSGLLVSVIVVRPDVIHIMYVAPMLCLMLGWIVDGGDIRLRIFRQARPLLNVYLLVSLAALGLTLLGRALNARQRIETRRGVITVPAPDTVIDYVQVRVPAGEKILVYPYLPLYYYLTGTFSATRYEYFQPGMNTPTQAQEALREIASSRPQVALFELGFDEKVGHAWPHTRAELLARDPVGDYILSHYHSCTILRSPEEWRFLFMVRNGLACPAG